MVEDVSFFLNTKTQATKDIHLREALYYAFPYEQAKSLAYKGMAEPASGPICAGQPGAELQNQVLGVPKQDMAKATAALKQSALSERRYQAPLPGRRRHGRQHASRSAVQGGAPEAQHHPGRPLCRRAAWPTRTR